MDDYVVISRRVLTGTMGDLPPTAWRAWIAVLFEAEKLQGKVKLPVRDLARLASITTEEAAEALRLFQEPDPYSNSKIHEGRRLLPVDGEENWYLVATWEKHREEREKYFARLRQQRWKKNQRGARSEESKRSVTVDNGSPLLNGADNGGSRSVTNEPEPEVKEESKPLERAQKRARSAQGDSFAALWSTYPVKRGRKRAFETFCKQIKTDADLAAIASAVANYRHEVEGRDESKIMHGARFFSGEWHDYVDGTWEPLKADSVRRDSRGFPQDGKVRFSREGSEPVFDEHGRALRTPV